MQGHWCMAVAEASSRNGMASNAWQATHGRQSTKGIAWQMQRSMADASSRNGMKHSTQRYTSTQRCISALCKPKHHASLHPHHASLHPHHMPMSLHMYHVRLPAHVPCKATPIQPPATHIQPPPVQLSSCRSIHSYRHVPPCTYYKHALRCLWMFHPGL